MATDFAKVIDADLKNAYTLFSPVAAQALASRRISGVRVLDYGQGDCNAVMAEDTTVSNSNAAPDSRPILFLDFGGGKHTGSRSHPWHDAWDDDPGLQAAAWRTKCPDLSLQPTVILSHWDGDHYSTAYYMANHARLTTKTPPAAAKLLATAVCGLHWLAPRQARHPSTIEFVADLGTSLRCWPKGVKEHTFPVDATTQVVVEKCDGGSSSPYDPNIDGLVVRIERLDSTPALVERIVVPGDGPFHMLPSAKTAKLDKVIGLVAFHHGSETHLAAAQAFIPVPLGPTGKIAYSFGLKPGGNRCYGHPKPEAIDEYQKANWTVRLHPSGGFTNWPPADGDTGDPAQRGDVDLPFTPQPSSSQASASVSAPPSTSGTSSSSQQQPQPPAQRKSPRLAMQKQKP